MVRRSRTRQLFIRLCHWTPILVALGAMVCIPGCCGNPVPPEDDNGEIVISDEVYIADDDADVAFVEADSTSVVLSYVGNPPDLEVDDILVGGDGGGYLRRVVSVTVDRGTLIVETSEATLSEVIEEGVLEAQGTRCGVGERGGLERACGDEKDRGGGREECQEEQYFG